MAPCLGFIRAADSGNYERATRYLDVRANPGAGPDPGASALLLSLIRIHLSRASTGAVEVLERDLQMGSRTGA
jgi:hypothetical protein